MINGEELCYEAPVELGEEHHLDGLKGLAHIARGTLKVPHSAECAKIIFALLTAHCIAPECYLDRATITRNASHF